MKTLSRISASLVFLFLQASIVHADLITTTLTLDPSPNEFTVSAVGTSASATSELRGTIEAMIDIDLVTGEISSLQLVGGAISTSDWVMTIPTVGDVSGVGIGATTDTPSGSQQPVTNDSFVASQHVLRLNAGTINLDGSPVRSFAVTPLDAEGTGNGTLTTTLANDVFDIDFAMNIDGSESVGGLTLGLAGTLSAAGQVEAVPEPSSGLLALTGGAVAFLLLRRRKARVRS